MLFPKGNFSFTYVNPLFNEYDDFELYRAEIIRLHNIITSFYLNEQILLHIVIGAVAEEIYDKYNMNIRRQWRQLFPIHIEKFLEDHPGKKVEIFVISPNKSFRNDYIPMFISMTNHKYRWNKNRLSFTSGNYPIRVRLFCTPMPHIDPQNSYIIQNLLRHNTNQNLFIKIKRLIQTVDDIEFIHRFYQDLQNMFDRVDASGGVITCFSYAVFIQGSKYTKYNRYMMFNEIIPLFHHPNRFLGEWIFTEKLNIYYIINYGSEQHTIFYDDQPDIKSTDGKFIDIIQSGLRLIINYIDI